MPKVVTLTCTQCRRSKRLSNLIQRNSAVTTDERNFFLDTNVCPQCQRRNKKMLEKPISKRQTRSATTAAKREAETEKHMKLESQWRHDIRKEKPKPKRLTRPQ